MINELAHRLGLGSLILILFPATVYAQLSITGENIFSTGVPINLNQISTGNTNSTEIIDSRSKSLNLTMAEIGFNNKLNQTKNQTEYLIEIKNVSNAMNAGNVAAQGSSGIASDFNGDGHSDLAVGVPLEDIGAIVDAGAVNVIYGSSRGLNATALAGDGKNDQFWSQDETDIEDNPEAGDNFGSVLASGDFNKDGYSDLAIGVSGEDIDAISNAGMINAIYGSSEGLSANAVSLGNGMSDQVWTQDSPNMEDAAEDGDSFGARLISGDYNNDGYSDLTIGVVFEDVGLITWAGAVNVIYGSSGGLSAIALSPGNGKNDQLWTQDSPNVEDASERDDVFCTALATGDFNKDNYSDLAIGVSWEDVGTIVDAGAVNVIYGSSGGLSAISLSPGNGKNDQLWTQDSPNVEDASERGDHLGYALTSGDFNRDGISDLAIGTALETVETINAAGAVNVIYGSTGITINSGGLSATVPLGGIGKQDQFWTQDSPNVEGIPGNDARFGDILVAGDFNKDGISDLAIGQIVAQSRIGAVNVMYGSSGGLSPIALSPGNGRNDQLWTQNSPNVEDASEITDFFGSALAPGDFNSDGISDLAIGVFGESFDTNYSAGAVNVIYGSTGITINSGGLSATVPLGGIGKQDQFWTQDSPNVQGAVEPGDWFGNSLG